jgi:ERF superfamily
MSDTNIYTSLIKFQTQVKAITKDAKNPFFKSKYADLASIQNTIKQPLIDCELGYIQCPEIEGLRTILFSSNGEKIETVYPYNIQSMTDAQKIGSAVSYAKRYALTAILGLIIDDDDDGNAAVSHVVQTQTAATAAGVEEVKTHWLSQEKLDAILASNDKKRIQDCLDCRELPSGEKFAMKKQYRDLLKAKLTQSDAEEVFYPEI